MEGQNSIAVWREQILAVYISILQIWDWFYLGDRFIRLEKLKSVGFHSGIQWDWNRLEYLFVLDEAVEICSISDCNVANVDPVVAPS